MKKSSWIAVISVVFSLSVALSLHWFSKDYEFTPRRREPVPQNRIAETRPDAGITRFVRTSGFVEPGNVEVQAVFLNPVEDLEDDQLVFQIAFNTHSVDMAGYDITQWALVENSKGRVIRAGFKWKVIHIQGYHHVSGILTVPNLIGRESLTAGEVEWIRLVLKGIPNLETREFHWEILT
ncbi:MAG TPA: hypothetical protein ENI27_04490 [bacterium]|nr:hypothetical protein [bacterium]